MKEQRIKELWDKTIDSQYDCEWDELSSNGKDQAKRFARLLKEEFRNSQEDAE